MLLSKLVSILKKHLIIEQSREGDVVTMVFSLDKYEITTISIDVSCNECKQGG